MTKKRPKIFVYLGPDLYYRNYLSVNAFDIPGYDLCIYGDPNTQYRFLYEADPARFKGFLSFPQSRLKNRLYIYLCTLLVVRFRKRSKTFTHRIESMNTRLQRIFKILCKSEFLADQVTKLLHFLLGNDSKIEEVLARESPDFLLAPSTTDIPIHYYLLKAARKLKIRSIALVDGWDNLSSKTVFPIPPDSMGVWGEQSEDHAVKIHSYPREKIFRIGTPRFDTYFKNSPRPTGLNFSEDYVLFTGSTFPLDELSVLRYLDWLIESQSIKNLKIVYRPHPWIQKRLTFNTFIETDFKHVVLDPTIKEYYWIQQFKPETRDYILPKLDDYPGLLRNCLFTVSSLTTMIIEAALVQKKVLIMAFDDGKHAMNPKKTLEFYEHFNGIEKIKAFKFCTQFRDLGRDFQDLLSICRSNIGLANDDATALNRILEPSTKPYRERLQTMIESL